MYVVEQFAPVISYVAIYKTNKIPTWNPSRSQIVNNNSNNNFKMWIFPTNSTKRKPFFASQKLYIYIAYIVYISNYLIIKCLYIHILYSIYTNHIRRFFPIPQYQCTIFPYIFFNTQKQNEIQFGIEENKRSRKRGGEWSGRSDVKLLNLIVVNASVVYEFGTSIAIYLAESNDNYNNAN